jgi:hypothetical protein
MTVLHKIIGYDRRTEVIAGAYDVPAGTLVEIKQLAHVDASDENASGSYPIEPAALGRVAELIGEHLDHPRFEFFLEPIAAPDRKRRPGRIGMLAA